MLVASVGLGVLVFTVSGPLSRLMPFNQYPCWLRMFCVVLVPGLIGGPGVIKLLLFNWMNRFSRMAAVNARENPKPWSEVEEGKTRPNAFAAAVRFLLVGMGLLCNRVSSDREHTLQALRFLVSAPGVIFVLFLCDLPFLAIAVILIATQPAYSAGCNGCLIGGFWIPFILISAALLLTGIVLAVVVYRIKDPWGLATEVRHMGFCLLLSFVGFIVGFAFGDNDTATDISLVMQTLGFCGVLYVVSLLQVYTASRKEGRIKMHRQKATRNLHGNDVGSENDRASKNASSHAPGGAWTVQSILDNAQLAELFEKHLTAELAVESLLFVRAIEDWKAKYATSSTAARRVRAKQLCETFIMLSGLHPVNIPSGMHDDVAKACMGAHDAEYVVPEGTFDKAVREVTYMMQTGAVMRFAQSKPVQELGLVA
jgi:hypothetical protein